MGIDGNIVGGYREEKDIIVGLGFGKAIGAGERAVVLHALEALLGAEAGVLVTGA